MNLASYTMILSSLSLLLFIKNFGHMTKEAAREYGDRKFVQMMMAKVRKLPVVCKNAFDCFI